MIKFLDTNALLFYCTRLDEVVPFVISSVTLTELEGIKTNKNKTEELRWKARKVVHWLNENTDKYTVRLIDDTSKAHTPDEYIIMTCHDYAQAIKDDEVIFITNDLLCKLIAELRYQLKTETTYSSSDNENYTGFKEVILSDEEMSYFYSNLNENQFNLLINQYLIIRDNSEQEVRDIRRWDGQTHLKADKKTMKSTYLDKLRAKDAYQSCVIDSLMENSITAISGKPGSGKSLLALMAAMNLIESGKYEQLVVMFNPVKVRGASDMGYYGGDFQDKAMQNSIGHILTTKFGDRYAVDRLVEREQLKLVSMADCRGMEIRDTEILWITEAQNTSIDLIKLCLSRVSSGAKVFIEGDYQAQVDANVFNGENNGLKRVIDVFKGHEEFGYVQLQNVWRSKIAELAELL